MASPLLRSRLSMQSALRPLRTPRAHAIPSKRLGNYYTQRPASTSSSSGTDSLFLARLKTVLFGTSIAATLYVGYLYATDTRASVHRFVVPPLLRLIYPDAEDAHHAGTKALRSLYPLNLHPRERPGRANEESLDSNLSVSVFGTTLTNPVGISAGLDKDAEIPDALFALGASVVEVGGCTPLPQEGNPKPRVFRIPDLDGMINRYGLNSRGADAMAARLRDRLRSFARGLGLSEREVMNGEGTDGTPPGSLYPGKLLLVQIAKNKKTDEKDVNAVIRDYVACVSRLAPFADVLVVNVSSPNTPGLRDLQATEPLTKILSAVVDEAQRTDRRTKPRVMVKVSPDEDDETQMEGVVQAVWVSGVDGIIVGNTTKRRTGLVPDGLRLTAKDQQTLGEEGGYSGPAMFDRTLSLVARYRKLLDGRSLQSSSQAPASNGEAPLPAVEGTVSGLTPSPPEVEQKVIFATGGITNGDQVHKILNAGASVAMVYTGLVYGGAGTITRIKGELKDEVSKGKA
ncbi:FMN-linked oxidoreductase [Thozetella sp. PMI_491]|nr:FMN-linked oxidoreductase [Thozetella sp. PMI_491]